MTELEQLIRDRIRRDGPMTFAAYMSLALYHPTLGYYSGGRPRTGWRGDYLTSAELHPVYGSLWARAFEDVWRTAGEPAAFVITEIGPGEGAFARSVLDALDGPLRDAVVLRLVERDPASADRQRATLSGHDPIEWIDAVGEVPTADSGCVIANEVLDNLPVHLVEIAAGRVLEVHVVIEDDGLTTMLQPPASPALESFLARHGLPLVDGARYEVSLAAEALAGQLPKLVRTGAVFLVDYGVRSDPMVPSDTLVTYSRSGPGTEPLIRPGAHDITAHVNWAAIEAGLVRGGMNVLGLYHQRDLLRALGAHESDDLFRREHEAALAQGAGASAVAALSARSALRVLLDPGGLGGFQVMVAARGISPPAFLERLGRSSLAPYARTPAREGRRSRSW